MLELKQYTRQELISIYKTDRLDAIKKKVTREGYKYTNLGRGKDYVMQIDELPKDKDSFKEYCINILGLAPQTNFDKFRSFIYYVLTDDTFINLQYAEMSRFLAAKEINITRQTLSEYMSKLEALNWIAYLLDEFNYYIFDKNINRTRTITQEEYKRAWKEFREGNYNSTNEAVSGLYSLCGALPRKKPVAALNAFYIDEYNKLLKIIETI